MQVLAQPLQQLHSGCSMFHVKHLSHEQELTPAAVVDAARSASVDTSMQQAELIIEHARLVVEANRSMNLTRLTAPADVLMLHIVDSLAFLPHVRPLDGRIIDIGSGAGYPGIPLAILGAELTLCESVKKKAAFLERVVAALGLEVPVEPVRAEELAARMPGTAAVVIARAVSATAALVELASPLLMLGGRLIALKGTPSPEELLSAQKVAPVCGLSETARVKYLLPTGEHRMVLVFEKTGKPRVALPRRPGAAQRQPLG